jgi:putative addiction module component (TIGR02574 family)
LPGLAPSAPRIETATEPAFRRFSASVSLARFPVAVRSPAVGVIPGGVVGSRFLLARQGGVRHYFRVSKPAIDLSKLTADEKLELLDELWLSLKPEDFAVTPEIRAELDRRLDRLDRESHGVTRWAEVRAKMTSQ